ncbi:MAG: Imm8 family immunity protein [Planctomycetota bacterium]
MKTGRSLGKAVAKAIDPITETYCWTEFAAEAVPLKSWFGFVVEIGRVNEEGAGIFEVVVTTPRAEGQVKRHHGKDFAYLTVERMTRKNVEQPIQARISEVQPGEWLEIVQALKPEFRWECDGMKEHY